MKKRLLDKLSTIFGSILLLISWGIITVMLAAFTEGWLAPWDTQRTRPPLGTWERSVNDFFEGPPGSLLPALIILCISITLYMYGRRNAKNKIKFTWIFVSINLFFLSLEVVFVTLFFHFPSIWSFQYFDFNNAYQRTAPAVLFTIVLLITMILTQGKISLAGKV